MNLSKVTHLESGKTVHSLAGEYSPVSKEHLTHLGMRMSEKLLRLCETESSGMNLIRQKNQGDGEKGIPARWSNICKDTEALNLMAL